MIYIVLFYEAVCVLNCKTIHKVENLDKLLVIKELWLVLFEYGKSLIKFFSMMLSLEGLSTIQELFQINFTISIGIGHSKELNKLVLVL